MRRIIVLLHSEFGLTDRIITCKSYRQRPDGEFEIGLLIVVKVGQYMKAFNLTQDELALPTDTITERLLMPFCQSLAFDIWSGSPPHVVVTFRTTGCEQWSENYTPDA